MTLKEPGHSRLPRHRRLGTTVTLFVGMSISMLIYFSTAQKGHVAPGSRISVTVTSTVKYAYLDQGVVDQPKSCRGPRPYMVIPRLLSVRQWHSCRPRQAESITLVTQLSLERLEMLENQCSVWSDPIAAVVYVPTLRRRILSADDASLNRRTLNEAVERLRSFYERMQQQGACVLDLELASQDFDEESEAGLYPVNAARNRALMLARTEAVLLLDADFVPSPNMLAKYKTPKGYSRLVERLNQPGAIVLPAFETASNGTDGKELALEAVQRGKQFAVEAYQQRKLFGFAMREYERGHYATNYDKWMTDDRPYDINYEEGYEPYIIVSRRFVPWYDERFRGYRKNKIQHITHLAGMNVTFSVHPAGFVVHVPHQKSGTYYHTRSTGEWYKLRVLYEMVEKEIKRQRFLPVVSFPQLCMR